LYEHLVTVVGVLEHTKPWVIIYLMILTRCSATLTHTRRRGFTC
jgi:F0F1-type ATP synthase assembly protein I